MTPQPPTVVVRLPLERNFDKQLDLCRFGARKDGVTVVIERAITRRNGDVRHVPVVTITPTGDIEETVASPLTVYSLQHIAEAQRLRDAGGMNARATRGHDRFLALHREALQRLGDAPPRGRARRQRPAPPTPPVASVTPCL